MSSMKFSRLSGEVSGIPSLPPGSGMPDLIIGAEFFHCNQGVGFGLWDSISAI